MTDLGYPTTHWPAGSDRDACRAMASHGCELNRSKEELAQAIGMIGFKREDSTGLIHCDEVRATALRQPAGVAAPLSPVPGLRRSGAHQAQERAA